MRLIFKTGEGDSVATVINAAHYRELWRKYQDSIKKAFYKHTGLTFKQAQITVRCTEGLGTSYSGNKREPMLLAIYASLDDNQRAGMLMHELGHRLLEGNKILTPIDGTEYQWLYKGHQRLYLFLCDAWVDVLGRTATEKLLRLERTIEVKGVTDGLEWALNKDYTERQGAIRKLIKNHQS